jgi:hypothetical protein
VGATHIPRDPRQAGPLLALLPVTAVGLRAEGEVVHERDVLAALLEDGLLPPDEQAVQLCRAMTLQG